MFRVFATAALMAMFLVACSQPAPKQDPWRSVGPIPPPPPTEAPPETEGNALTQKQMVELENTIQVGQNASIRCYEDELERRGNKDLSGSVMVKIHIGTKGKALSVEVGDISTIKVPAIHQCIVEAAMNWEYPLIERPYRYSTTFNLSPAY